MRLSQKTVSTLAPGPRRILWDDEVKGFGVRITGGSCSYIVDFRVGARRRRVALGPTNVLPFSEARRKAQRVLVAALDGADLTVDERKGMPTLVEVWTEMIEQIDRPKLSPATIADYEDRAKRLFLPTLGPKLIADITVADIDRVVSATSGERNRAYVLALIKKTFNHAKRARLLPDSLPNPADAIKVKRRKKSVARALDIQEIEAFGRSLGAFESAGAVSPWLANFFRLALICGLRPGEVRSLVWKNIDFEKRQATVTGKTGSRIIHLTDAAIRVLRSTPKIENNPHVFCGRRQGEPLAGIYRALQMVAERAGVKKFRPYDLRHSAATGALASGADVRAVQALLGHSDLRTTQSYLHETDGRRKAAAESAANWGRGVLQDP